MSKRIVKGEGPLRLFNVGLYNYPSKRFYATLVHVELVRVGQYRAVLQRFPYDDGNREQLRLGQHLHYDVFRYYDSRSLHDACYKVAPHRFPLSSREILYNGALKHLKELNSA